MKYDDFEKVESTDYPNENVVIKNGKYDKLKSKVFSKNRLDMAISGVFFATSFALVLLFTSIITLAVSGDLSVVLTNLFR